MQRRTPIIQRYHPADDADEAARVSASTADAAAAGDGSTPSKQKVKSGGDVRADVYPLMLTELRKWFVVNQR